MFMNELQLIAAWCKFFFIKKSMACFPQIPIATLQQTPAQVTVVTKKIKKSMVSMIDPALHRSIARNCREQWHFIPTGHITFLGWVLQACWLRKVHPIANNAAFHRPPSLIIPQLTLLICNVTLIKVKTVNNLRRCKTHYRSAECVSNCAQRCTRLHDSSFMLFLRNYLMRNYSRISFNNTIAHILSLIPTHYWKNIFSLLHSDFGGEAVALQRGVLSLVYVWWRWNNWECGD